MSEVGDTLFKNMIISAVLVFVAGPGSVPVSAKGVPLPPQVSEQALEMPRMLLDGVTEVDDTSRKPAVMAPGSQLRVIEVLGRSLALSLMRADRTGLAVLSVPKRSVIGSLPEIEPEEFRAMVAEESGCRTVGRVQVVGSRRGAVAMATGLACS